MSIKQVIQSVQNGELQVQQRPLPVALPGHVLVANCRSVISAGTEKTARNLARTSLLGKARARPDHVRRVVDKMRQEGVLTTIRQVREKLDEPMTLGYSSAGVVLATGADVQDFKPGDRVASNGPHGEVVCVPKNLCARIPDNVDYDEAAFAVMGAIAMQGVRLSKVSLGETVLVIGLGLVGQITVALLKAAGIDVVGTDPDPARCKLAEQMGASTAVAGSPLAELLCRAPEGADAVLITASTASNAPIELAAKAVRQKGRVVLVGVVGLQLDRRPFYFKEAEFVVSCSYGPGRYDADYEELGRDYPLGHVRWTEQRNIQAVLDLLGRDSVRFTPLISHRFSIDQATHAYDLIDQKEEPFLGVLLEYPDSGENAQQRFSPTVELPARPTGGDFRFGCLGAGNFARMTLLPKLCKIPGVSPQIICSAGGGSAVHTGKKLGFSRATTSEAEVFQDENVDAVFILTQHHLHAQQIQQAIEAGKHVFVEKPLCCRRDELTGLETTLQAAVATRAGSVIMVGYNRRFAPATKAIRSMFHDSHVPLTVSIRFNAGAISADHWTQRDELGGGRIIGEACHGIDLAIYLTGSPVERVYAESIGGPNSPTITDDQCYITLKHVNGSVSNIAYLAGGDKSCPKERVEVFGDGKTAIIDDFRIAYGWADSRQKRLWKGSQDKGHAAGVEAFVEAVRSTGDSPIPWSELHNSALSAILAVESLRKGKPIAVETSEMVAGQAARRLAG